MDSRYPALILLGPTGSGKTPLGEMLTARGILEPEAVEGDRAAGGPGNSGSTGDSNCPRGGAGGRRCEHFDFGQNLRDVAARGVPDAVVSAADVELVRRLLASGALLEDQDFPLAERLLNSFLVRRRVDRETCVVLNGLPRHEGQAAALDRLLRVERVVLLECAAETVVARIASDAGGDRAGRTDDTLPEVRRKLEVFRQRTVPLLGYYQLRGVRAQRLQVGVRTSAEELWRTLCRSAKC